MGVSGCVVRNPWRKVVGTVTMTFQSQENTVGHLVCGKTCLQQIAVCRLPEVPRSPRTEKSSFRQSRGALDGHVLPPVLGRVLGVSWRLHAEQKMLGKILGKGKTTTEEENRKKKNIGLVPKIKKPRRKNIFQNSEHSCLQIESI